MLGMLPEIFWMFWNFWRGFRLGAIWEVAGDSTGGEGLGRGGSGKVVCDDPPPSTGCGQGLERSRQEGRVGGSQGNCSRGLDAEGKEGEEEGQG